MRTKQTQQILDSYSSVLQKWIFPMVYLYGEIGTGKSTTLQETLSSMKDQFNFVVIDLDCVEIKNHGWMFYNVMRQIKKECRIDIQLRTMYNFTSFSSSINSVIEKTERQVVISLDNIHLLEKKSSSQLVTFLLQLHEFTNGDACVFATSRIPWERFIQDIAASSLLLSGFTPMQIYFEQYSNRQVETILKQLHPQHSQNVIFANFLHIFVFQVYPYVRNVPEIGQHVPRIFEKFNNARDQFANRWSLKAFQHSQINAEMREIMGLSHISDTPISRGNDDEDEDMFDQIQLSKVQKYILVAVFIGSRVHNKMDAQYFARQAGVSKKGRKTNKSVTIDSSKGKKTLNDLPLNRLLAIMYSLMSNQLKPEPNWSRLDVMQQISTLCSMHYLERTSKDDTQSIDLDQPVLRLSNSGNVISFDMAKKLARSFGMSLEQFGITH
jgi:hypothetical protein